MINSSNFIDTTSSNNNNDVDFTDTVTSPTGSISSSSNITFVTKQIRKKPYIPRPPNSFILYRQHHHPLILNKNPGINNSEISRIIADHWRRLSDKEKDEWKRKAEEAKERHMKAWPDYKYQPRRRVVGPTFKKPLKGPGGINNNDEDLSKSVVIIAGGSKALALRNNNNKPSPSDMLNAKFAVEASSNATQSTFHQQQHHHQQQHQTNLHQFIQQPKLLGIISSTSSTSTSASASNNNTTAIKSSSIATALASSSSSSSTIISSSLNNNNNNNNTNRGALIVLEGCDDYTTTLQSTKLLEFLKNEGINARLWKFPDISTPSGSAIKTYQTNNNHQQQQSSPKIMHLLTSAHWWELMECLLSGTTLIVDRYVYSAIASSTAAGLDLNWCKGSYVHLLSPDLIFYLNMERDFSSLPSIPNPHDFLIGRGNIGKKECKMLLYV
ncbi:14276_t:CDS:2 [Entrophospora sp. SA101]|nr:14276_t:CDS:2 [Entrophospora sp. SA101]